MEPVTRPWSVCRWYGTETECDDGGGAAQQQYSCYIPSNLALFTPYQMWVEATNQLGSASSDITTLDVLDVGRSRLVLGLLREFTFIIWACKQTKRKILNHFCCKSELDSEIREEDN